MPPDDDDDLDPVAVCPYKKHGNLMVEVTKYRAGTKGKDPKPVNGVTADVTGGKKPFALTTANGRATSQKLDPGGYTVTLDFPPNVAETLDLSDATTSLTKDVKKNKTTPYVFSVPYNWVKYEVKYTDGSWAPGIPYFFRRKKNTDAGLEKDWTLLTDDKSTASTIDKEEVPAGKYFLALKLLWGAAWSADRVVVDDEIEMSASVSGYELGDAGIIQVYDAGDYATLLKTLDAKVSQDTGKKILKIKWKPSKADLATLKSGRVVFSGKIGQSSCFSDPRPVFYKEPLDLEDDEGNKLTAQVKLRLSGGFAVDQNVAGGHADLVLPWGQKLARVDLPGHKKKRVHVDADGIPTRSLLMPAT